MQDLDCFQILNDSVVRHGEIYPSDVSVVLSIFASGGPTSIQRKEISEDSTTLPPGALGSLR